MVQRSISFTRSRPAPAPLLAVLTTALLAPVSPASVVVHDNSGGVFQWKLSYNLSGTDDIIGTFLDITKPATQNGVRSPGTFGQWYEPNVSSSEPAIRYIQSEGTNRVAETTLPVQIDWKDDVFFVRTLREYFGGEQVDGSANWKSYALYFFHLPNTENLSKGTAAISNDAYFGVQVSVDGQLHHGWIRFVNYTTPVAWAYETQPDTPVQIPVPPPTSGANMLILCMGLSTRRRRI